MDIRETESPTLNPYWEEIRTQPGGMSSSLYSEEWRPASHNSMILMDETLSMEERLELLHTTRGRDQFVQEYSWAIPDPLSLEFLRGCFPKGTRVVECGAGNGYWANQLDQLGFVIEAYDISPRPNSHFQVIKGNAHASSLSKANVLFLCWPPYNEPMAFEALSSFKGDTLIYIGETEGGCTADEDFFNELENWDRSASFPILSYEGIHDYIHIFERR